MVDVTRDKLGITRVRLLDLVPGRSGKAYAAWLDERGDVFRNNVKVAALDPFAVYKTAIDDKLEDSVAVLDAFHVVKLGTAAEVRRRVQQDTLGHRGHKGDPLYGVQTILRAGAENLTEKQRSRLVAAIEANPATTRCSSRGSAPSSCAPPTTPGTSPKGAGSRRESSTRSTPARSPRSPASAETLRRWREAFLAYLPTSRSSNSGTEAVNGIIELHRRLARGLRNRHNYRLHMLLATGGLTS